VSRNSEDIKRLETMDAGISNWRTVALTAGLFWFTVSMNRLIFHLHRMTWEGSNVTHACEDAICLAGSICGFAGSLKSWRPSLIIFAFSLLPYITLGFTHFVKLYDKGFSQANMMDVLACTNSFLGLLSAIVFLRYVSTREVRRPARVRWVDARTESSSRGSRGFMTAESVTWDTFSNPLLDRAENLPSMEIIPPQINPEELSLEELGCIKCLKERILDVEWTLCQWLRLAYAGCLDPETAYNKWLRHKNKVEYLKLDKVTKEAVQKNYDAGFSVVAGRDRLGRPLVWLRFKYIVPSVIPLDAGIVSTWAALDASLQDVESIRGGVTLVYDFADVQLKNVMTMKPFDFKEGIDCVALSHTSTITCVLFLNAPHFFRYCWNLALPIVPKALKEVVRFIDSDESDECWYNEYLSESQLPEYLGGPPRQNYFDWLCMRLEREHVYYKSF